ncbi:MAG: primosomal protein N' [Clostridia bacterium]
MIARVIVDISNSEVDKVFDYNIPFDVEISKGDRVLVPFGPKNIEGFCIDLVETSPYGQLKDISARLDTFTCISDEMLQLMRYMKEKFYVRYVDSLRLFIPSKMRGGRLKEQLKGFVQLNPDMTLDEIKSKISARAKSQLAIVERLAKGGEYQTIINNEFSNVSLKALLDGGLVVRSEQLVYRRPQGDEGQSQESKVLTDEQKVALEQIFSAPTDTILLNGVTGSGKTLVYMTAIKRVLQEGKTAIMLVPEISLTPQTLRNFRAYFGESVAMLHSGLSDGERYDEWKRLLCGDAKIVVGARSAVFAPVQNLGIIIVDEEHDSSYISESNPRYKTIDVARFRAKYNNAKVVLGSATPSIESFMLARKGEYTLAQMPTRISEHGMPPIQIVDMSKEVFRGNNGIFSGELQEELTNTLKRGEQAIIFLNRRGHSSFVMCRKCGYIAKCQDCDVSLTYHSTENMLKCHYCGKRYKMLTRCPSCGSDEIRYGKVGTQRVVSELEKIFPKSKILRMDNETTTTKSAYLDILGAFAAREADILVGTQMIAKGHDFPDVTLVGILDADMSLYYSDYRSNERTFQLITQVAGRAGRSEKAGKVLLQTYSPRHYVYNFVSKYDYVGFFDKEINTRLTTDFPPFSTILRVLMSGENEENVIDCAKIIYSDIKEYCATQGKNIIYLQAMRSPISRIQTKFRYQVLMRIKRENEDEITSKIYSIIDEAKKKNTSVFVEINPQNLS